MARRHLVISGTGRAGTTFLVELLTRLGVESGFNCDEIPLHCDRRARAGLEKDIRDADCPYLVKSPHFCQYASEVLSRNDITIDHVLIPMRDIQAAAESRRYVSKLAMGEWSLMKRWVKKCFHRDGVAGGAPTDPRAAAELELILLKQLYGLVLALSNSSVPVTLLRYPRLIQDCSYLFEKLRFIIGATTYDQFRHVFENTVRPDLAHSFNENDR